MEGYIGEIRVFAGNFAPQGWVLCDGKPYSIRSYDAAYSILGTLYGGDGTTTFNVPDLRGRLAVGIGQVAGSQQVMLGEKGGNETVAMSIAQMPNHNHVASATVAFPAYSHLGEIGSPQGSVLAGLDRAYSTKAPDTNIAPAQNTGSLSSVGQGLPFGIVQPVLAVNYIICMVGIYPSRQ